MISGTVRKEFDRVNEVTGCQFPGSRLAGVARPTPAPGIKPQANIDEDRLIALILPVVWRNSLPHLIVVGNCLHFELSEEVEAWLALELVNLASVAEGLVFAPSN